MSQNLHTGINPHRRPKNKANAQARVDRAAKVVAYLNKAKLDEAK